MHANIPVETPMINGKRLIRGKSGSNRQHLDIFRKKRVPVDAKELPVIKYV